MDDDVDTNGIINKCIFLNFAFYVLHGLLRNIREGPLMTCNLWCFPLCKSRADLDVGSFSSMGSFKLKISYVWDDMHFMWVFFVECKLNYDEIKWQAKCLTSVALFLFMLVYNTYTWVQYYKYNVNK